MTENSRNSEECWRIMINTEECWTILRNTEECWRKIMTDIEEHWRMDDEEMGKISGNTGNSVKYRK